MTALVQRVVATRAARHRNLERPEQEGIMRQRNYRTTGVGLWGGVRAGCLLAIMLLVACQPAAPAVDHMAIAKELSTKIQTDTGKTQDYSNAAYEQVAQELQLVPEGAPEKAEADAWLKQIQEARRQKLWTVPEQEGGSLAHLARTSSMKFSHRSNGGAPPGWSSTEANVDVAAITASVRSGQTSALTSSSGVPTRPSAKKSSAQAALTSVTIYTTSWCGVCKAAKAYMAQRGISYVERDIERDPSAKAEVLAKTGGNTSVPVIDVNGNIMVGFEKRALDRMLSKASL